MTALSTRITRLSKISWFVSVEQINSLQMPKAEANNWSVRHWQITIFCDNCFIIYLFIFEILWQSRTSTNLYNNAKSSSESPAKRTMFTFVFIWIALKKFKWACDILQLRIDFKRAHAQTLFAPVICGWLFSAVFCRKIIQSTLGEWISKW